MKNTIKINCTMDGGYCDGLYAGNVSCGDKTFGWSSYYSSDNEGTLGISVTNKGDIISEIDFTQIDATEETQYDRRDDEDEMEENNLSSVELDSIVNALEKFIFKNCMDVRDEPIYKKYEYIDVSEDEDEEEGI